MTAGFTDGMSVGKTVPNTEQYFEKGLCPVNVHWHLGTEHRSKGDEDSKGPMKEGTPARAGPARWMAGDA